MKRILLIKKSFYFSRKKKFVIYIYVNCRGF